MKKFQDWSKKTINFQSGCENDCVYCYAKRMAKKFKQPAGFDWANPTIREKDVKKKHKNYGEVVMFPSSHDLTIDNWKYGKEVLRNLLKAGNQVLIVTKPRYEIIEDIMKTFAEYRQQILFRFTITSMYDEDFEEWEPGAPRFMERLDSLDLAYELGFNTSVSIEPIINPACVVNLFKTLEPAVTETIWIGKMNHIPADEIPVCCGHQIRYIYEALKSEPKVRWKTGTLEGVIDENETKNG